MSISILCNPLHLDYEYFREELVFEYDTIELKRYDMMTLRKGNVVGTMIVDAWAVYLNDNERNRSKGSPTRFFATTSICVSGIKCNFVFIGT